MSKRKAMDKEQARERRNRLLESAAAAELSLTDGVREMRAVAGMTQDEFARHREVSARVVKAIELGQGNPTVATLNRIGQFFGLEVGFVPLRRPMANDQRSENDSTSLTAQDLARELEKVNDTFKRQVDALFQRMDSIMLAHPEPDEQEPSKHADARSRTARPNKKAR